MFFLFIIISSKKLIGATGAGFATGGAAVAAAFKPAIGLSLLAARVWETPQ